MEIKSGVCWDPPLGHPLVDPFTPKANGVARSAPPPGGSPPPRAAGALRGCVLVGNEEANGAIA